jgi:hypothetical protein
MRSYTETPQGWGSGGLRLKHDISEYADYIIQNFKAPEVEVKFRLLGT